MTKIIEIVVSPTGQSTVQTKGFTGSSCRAASEFLETALGQRTAERLTSEYSQREIAQQTLHQGG